MSLAWLGGLGRRQAREARYKTSAALSQLLAGSNAGMISPASSRASPGPCLQRSAHHGQQSAFTTLRQSAQSAAAPLHPRPASGCEPSATWPARGMHVLCSADGSTRGSKSKGSRATPPSPSFQTDLGQIRGVGPVNEALLISQGVNSVQALTNLYRGLANSDSHEMMKYLQGKVGIKFKRHCQAITDHLKDLAPAQTVSSSAGVTLCVEGNISAGKSTFLNLIEETINNGLPEPQVSVVPEPVDTWQNLHGGGNILDAFYRDPQRYAYTFQNYVFLSRCMQERDKKDAELRLLERSVFSDRMVFVKAVHESKYMSDLELSVYNSWFDPMVKDILPSIVPDGFIYLRAQPDLCSTRMALRNRSEESNVPLEYLQMLHDKHEDWLYPNSRPWAHYSYPANSVQTGVLLDQFGNPLSGHQHSSLVSVHPDMASHQLQAPPAAIKDDVVRLTQGMMPSLHDAIVDTPALVLNCGPDLRSDQAAREDFAAKVKTYYEWVKGCKERAKMQAARNVLNDAFPKQHVGWSEKNRPFLSQNMWPGSPLPQISVHHAASDFHSNGWNGHALANGHAQEQDRLCAVA